MTALQPTSAQSTPGLLDLESELSCSICTDILYQPLTLLDCLHTFCGSCLKEWFRWQAEKELSSRQRDRTRKAVQNPFTCPSCRATVRDTRPNATVTTLLDMYTRVNPGRIKSEEERKEADKGYTLGEIIMPELPVQDEDEEEDAEEYGRMLDEILDQSVRELDQSMSDLNLSNGSNERQSRRANRPRTSEPTPREERDREDRRRRSSRDARARNNDQTSNNPRVVRSEEDASQTAAAIRRATTGLDRASSIRISQRLSELEVRETEEDIMRQIVDEGLLDGIDVHNLDSRQEEEIADRIARAYRRRREQQARMPRELRTRQQEQVLRPISNRDVPTRQAPVPSAWQTRQQQSTSARSSSHGRRPLNEPENRGRRQSEQPVIASAPSAWQPLDVRQSRQRSSSRNSRRTPSADPSQRRSNEVSRLSNRAGTDSAIQIQPVSPLIVPRTRASDPLRRATDSATERRQNGSPYAPQIIAADGPAVDNSITSSFETASPISTFSPTAVDPIHNSHHTTATTASPSILAPSRGCFSCNKSHIEYTLHHICRKCGPSNAPYTLCHRCYQLGKGCKHWFGFGHVAQSRFARQAPPDAELPHIMEPERYTIIQPKTPVSAAESSSTATVLERGVFCSICTANSKNRYWTCSTCNSGEWGYCDTCVLRGRHCTHPLALTTCVFVPPSLASSSVRGVPQLIRALPLASIPPYPAEGNAEPRPRPSNSILKAAGGNRSLLRMQALWTRVPDDGIKDELQFPRGAEITDVVDVNGEWGWGVYCNQGGLLPLAYCRAV